MALVAERLSLSTVLQSWMRRQRLKPADLVRLSGLSRPTVSTAREGGKVSSDTVRALAVGLARDPYDGTIDARVYGEALRELAEAAGFPHMALEIAAAPDIAESIRPAVRSPEVADLWAEIIRDNPDATPDQLALLRSLYSAIKQQKTPHLGDDPAPSKGSNP